LAQGLKSKVRFCSKEQRLSGIEFELENFEFMAL